MAYINGDGEQSKGDLLREHQHFGGLGGGVTSVCRG